MSLDAATVDHFFDLIVGPEGSTIFDTLSRTHDVLGFMLKKQELDQISPEAQAAMAYVMAQQVPPVDLLLMIVGVLAVSAQNSTAFQAAHPNPDTQGAGAPQEN